MTKLNKILLFSTILLSVVIISVLSQTIYRNRQVETLRNEIKEAIQQSGTQDDMISAIQSYEERIKFVYEHKPLMNLNIGLSSSFAEQRPELCQSIYTAMTNNTVVLNFLENTNLEVENKTRTKEQIQEIQQAAKGLYLVSGCLL